MFVLSYTCHVEDRAKRRALAENANGNWLYPSRHTYMKVTFSSSAYHYGSSSHSSESESQSHGASSPKGICRDTVLSGISSYNCDYYVTPEQKRGVEKHWAWTKMSELSLRSKFMTKSELGRVEWWNEMVKVGGFQVGDSTMWAGTWAETWSSEGAIESLEVRRAGPTKVYSARSCNFSQLTWEATSAARHALLWTDAFVRDFAWSCSRMNFFTPLKHPKSEKSLLRTLLERPTQSSFLFSEWHVWVSWRAEN